MRLTQFLRAKKLWPKRAELPPTSAAINEAFTAAAADFAREAGVMRDVTLDRPEWLKLATPLIERFEGMARLIPGDKVEAYPDPATGGKPWTIGIGSTTDESGNPIEPGTIWTVARARKRFEAHVLEFNQQLDGILMGAPTNDRQRAALVSLIYNIGPDAALGSTLLRKHIAGDYMGAAEQFDRWKWAGCRVLKGLLRRRAAERELYLS